MGALEAIDTLAPATVAIQGHVRATAFRNVSAVEWLSSVQDAGSVAMIDRWKLSAFLSCAARPASWARAWRGSRGDATTPIATATAIRLGKRRCMR